MSENKIEEVIVKAESIGSAVISELKSALDYVVSWGEKEFPVAEVELDTIGSAISKDWDSISAAVVTEFKDVSADIKKDEAK